MCVLVQIEIEIVMAMTQRAFVHMKTQGDNNETRMRRMVSVYLCACVNSPTFPAKAAGDGGDGREYVSAGGDTGATGRSGKLLQYRHEEQR